MSRIDVFKPTCGDAELAQVADCFRTGWLGKGQKVAAFEAAWAAHIGVDPAHVVSVSCATEGLFQILDLIQQSIWGWHRMLSQVIIPSIHFIGADNAIRACGGYPTYCDVDPHTLNPTLENIIAAYSPNHTRAVMLLHYGGVAQELDSIRVWCDSVGVRLIEDAACAQATTYKGKAAGTWGRFGVWSFDAMKVITTGDGGMVYCENRADADRLRKQVYLGTDTPSGLSSNHDRWWEYGVANLLARRAIMNDIAAGIGLEQLKRLPEFVERRHRIVFDYNMSLLPLVTVPLEAYGEDDANYYFYWIQTPRRDDLARHLRANNIYTTFRYHPLHRVFNTGQSLPGADYAADHTLLLPLHQGLTDDDVQYVIEKVKEFFA